MDSLRGQSDSPKKGLANVAVKHEPGTPPNIGRKRQVASQPSRLPGRSSQRSVCATIPEPFESDQAQAPQDSHMGQVVDVVWSHNLYPSMSLSQPISKPCRTNPGTMHQSGFLSSAHTHREQLGARAQVNPHQYGSPNHPASTHRRESIKSLRSKGTTHSASWTGDADFFPNSGTPPLAPYTSPRALNYHFQALSTDPGKATNAHRPRADSRVQTWLERLPPFPPAPDDIENLSTPPLSPNIETERSHMRRWLRNWDEKERKINIDDDDVFGRLGAGKRLDNAP